MAGSATILFTCEACGVQGRVPESFRGKTARCPSCKHVQIIPMNAPSPPISGKTERTAKPTITRSLAAPRKDEQVSDDTRGRALLGIVERLEKVESLNERLHGSLQRLQTRSNAGDEDVDQRIEQLQSSLTQTQHTVTGLLHTETRLDAMGKKLDVLQRAANRSDQDKQFKEIFEQLTRLQRQFDGGQVKTSGSSDSMAPILSQLSDIEQRIGTIEAQEVPAAAPLQSEQSSVIELHALQDEMSVIRTELEERVHSLSNELASLKNDSDSKPNEDIPELEMMAVDLRAVEEEVVQLRSTLADMPSHVQTETKPAKSNPALAIFALLIGLGGAGFAGFVFTQVTQLQDNQANFQASTNDTLAKQTESISFSENSTNSALEAQKSTIETANSLAGNANSLAGKAMTTAEEGKAELAALESESNQSLGSLETKFSTSISQLESNQKTLLADLTAAQEAMKELATTPAQKPDLEQYVTRSDYEKQLAELSLKLEGLTKEVEKVLDAAAAEE